MAETKSQHLETELQTLRAEVRALREQVASYSAQPPVATDHPHIVRIKNVKGGEPLVRGAYVTVRGIVELTQQGQSPEQIAEEHAPLLSLAQVHDALSYYFDHPAEVEQYIREQKEALRRATQLSREIARRRKRAEPANSRRKTVANAGRR